MRFTLFGGLVIVVCIALTYARRFSAGCHGACSPQGFEYAFLVSLEILVALLIVSLGTALVRWLPSSQRDAPPDDDIVGSPVQAQNYGRPMVVDEVSMSEAVLNPSATVDAGARPACRRFPVG